MRCDDDQYYVVKFQNNPQHLRVLANEMLGTKLAARIGLTTPAAEPVYVSEEMIALTPDLCVELPRQRIPFKPGVQFGSRFPGDPRKLTLFDFLPDTLLNNVVNKNDFLGMLAFDKWTCNTNGRQVLFRPEGEDEAGCRSYKAFMIDQGFCFNAGEWDFPDGALRGLYSRNCVYTGVTGIRSFEPWLERVRSGITEKMLDSILKEIPPEWYNEDLDSMYSLLEKLYRRRDRVPELLLAAKNTTRRPFPNWI